MANQDFPAWLQDQLNRKKWTQADLARYANTTRSAINGLIQGTRRPGPDLCQAIAYALGLPPEIVFRVAGLLPNKLEADEITERAEYILKNYKYPETKARALEYLEFLRIQEEQGAYDAKPAPKNENEKRNESLKKALGV
jgi:transcriptional regulator with XRE-family HTH domain